MVAPRLGLATMFEGLVLMYAWMQRNVSVNALRRCCLLPEEGGMPPPAVIIFCYPCMMKHPMCACAANCLCASIRCELQADSHVNNCSNLHGSRGKCARLGDYSEEIFIVLAEIIHINFTPAIGSITVRCLTQYSLQPMFWLSSAWVGILSFTLYTPSFFGILFI